MTRSSATSLMVFLLSCGGTRDPPERSRAGPDSGSVTVLPSSLDSLFDDAEAVYFDGDYDSARALFRRGLVRARAAVDSAAEARALTWLGLAAWRLGDYDGASRLGEDALALKLRLDPSDPRTDLSRSYNALGLLAWNEGRLTDATVLFEQAGDAAGQAGDSLRLHIALGNLALVRTDLGDFAGARQGFLGMREAGRRADNARVEGNALTNLGMLEMRLGAAGAAIQWLEQARERYRAVDYVTGEENALGHLSTAYAAQGELGRAIAANDSALALARSQGMRQEEASHLESLAALYRDAGDAPRALALYAEATAINTELGLETEVGTDLRAEAEIQHALGYADAARAPLTRALEIHSRLGVRFEELADRLLLAELAHADGDRAAVERHLASARRLAQALDARRPVVEVALVEARLADRQGAARKALDVLDALLPELGAAGYDAEWEARAMRARAYARLDLLDSAAAEGRRAVAAVERVRGNFGSEMLRTSYLADRSSVHADLVEVLLRLGYVAEAWQVADAARGRALLERAASGDGQAQGVDGAAAVLAEGEALLLTIGALVFKRDSVEALPLDERGDALAEIEARLGEARDRYETLAVLSAEHVSGGSALLGAAPMSPSEVRRSLGPNEVLLEYLVTGERLVIFAVTAERVVSLASEVSAQRLVSRVRLAREIAGAPQHPEENGQRVLEALHQALIGPLARAGALRGAERLIVVPHGALAYLPFAALRDSLTARSLVQDYSVVHLPSAAALPVLRSTARRASLGAVRGVSVAFAPFPRDLPATRTEAEAVRRAVGRARVRLAGQATEADLRHALASGGLVHVATHGVMNARSPLFSRLELAPGTDGRPENDGRLEVHELLDFKALSPLVFLSGCETGLGAAWSTEFARAEDYATLAQAFLYAGAANVVATLWRVEDQGAAAFAERFYRLLRDHPPPEALARAQREMMGQERWAAPYYWAGFVLSGGGEVRSGAQKEGILSVRP